MDLKTLLAPLQKFQTKGDLDLDITGISYDSRKIKAGNLFAALPGVHFHGNRFIADAEKSGAVAVLTDLVAVAVCVVVAVSTSPAAVASYAVAAAV